MGPAATGEPEREHPGLQGNALSHGLALPSRSLVGQDKWPQSPEFPRALLEPWLHSRLPPSALRVLPADTQPTVSPESHGQH